VKFLVLLLVCLAAACSGYEKLPRQDDATTIVWRLTYGELANDPPQVQWIFQKDLNCGADTTGRFLAFYRWRWYGDVSHSDVCVGGVTWEDWGPFCQVALSDGLTFSTSAFSHELYHAFLHYRDGDGDASHADPGFGTDFGHPYGTVDAARDALKAEGL
jgi:hypothetical protein